jgi:ATP-binding cassette, subfamily B, bacterial PglK
MLSIRSFLLNVVRRFPDHFSQDKLSTASLIVNQYTRSDKIKLVLAAALQFMLAFLDLIGVFLIGILGSVTIYGVQSKNVGNRTNRVLEVLNIDSLSFHRQVVILALLAFTFLFAKTLISTYVTKKILYFLYIKGSILSGRLIKSIYQSRPYEVIEHRKMDLVHAVTLGIDGISTRIVATSIVLFSDFALLVILFLGMLYINPLTTVIAFLIFGLAFFILNRMLKGRAFTIGKEEMNLAMKSNREILEGLNTYSELYVHDRQNNYADRIAYTRHELGKLNAGRSMLPILGKLFFEISLLLGTLIVSGVQFLIYDATYAIAGLFIFFAAASRIAPALLRIQQNLITIRGALGSSGFTIELLNKFTSPEFNLTKYDSDKSSQKGASFTPKVELKSVDFNYSEERSFSFSNLNVVFEEGTFNAIVGASGSGKSSLVNLVLGINNPRTGEVLISGLNPRDAFRRWPGQCSYVPQNCFLVDGTIEENIALGFSHDEIDTESVDNAIDMANLREFIEQLPLREKTHVGDEGKLISGGQKQRIVLARALYTRPKLLILDEATSSLDLESERQIAEVMMNLKGKVTLIVIAHRLNSIINADKVLYLDAGRVLATGSFSEVRQKIPNFENSADIFGFDKH